MGSKIDRAVQWAIDIANDDTHGYSQSVRWGDSYDCSSLIISAWQEGAGVPVKTYGASFTGNIYPIFKNCGFADVTSLCNLATGTGLEKGDVLLNTASHTAMYIGDGQIVHARSSEGTSDTVDNSGNEIRVQAYFNYNPWNYVLRYYDDDEETSSTTTTSTVSSVSSANLIPNGTEGKGIAALQGILIYLGYELGSYGKKRDGIDGDAGYQGSRTNTAMRQALIRGELTKEEVKTLLTLN